MKTFIHENFLLNNKKAVRLYHEYAENKPIIDFHCHLSPLLISEDHQFGNITKAWLEGDHYKWRAMRTNGISEKYCTGNGSDIEKFGKWAETVAAAAGNPLYHWTHLELARYFNITELLSPATASQIYERASSMLRSASSSARAIIRKMSVEVICTTDDPADDLKHHLDLKNSFEIKVIPTFRPDNVIKTENPDQFKSYIRQLELAATTEIKSFQSLMEVLDQRHGFFHEMGCRSSDHGLDHFFYATFTSQEVERIFKHLLSGDILTFEESEKYKTAVMLELCRLNNKRGWVQQFHVGALRNNNSRKFHQMGPDTGWDSIGPVQDPLKISKFLNELDNKEELAKTIIYDINPADNEMMITMAGNFNDGSTAGKVQFGAAWWFLDQKTGMEKHLKDLASLSLLRRFIGMVTDSRSFLSYPRHEYFRRLLCNYVGEEVEKGLIPDEEELLKPLIEGISYRNAKEYFGF